MSAYMVDQAHVGALVHAALARRPLGGPGNVQGPMYWEGRPLTADDADKLGQMLQEANRKSVQHRYPGDSPTELPGPIGVDWSAPFVFAKHVPTRRYTVLELLVAINGYEYQACEHPDWMAGNEPAIKFCEALRSHLVRALPGYHDCDTWCIFAPEPVGA